MARLAVREPMPCRRAATDRRTARALVLLLAMALVPAGAPATAEATADGPDFLRFVLPDGERAVRMLAGPGPGHGGVAQLRTDRDGLRNFGCVGGLGLAEWAGASEAERLAARARRWCRVGLGSTIGWLPGASLIEGGDTGAFHGGGALAQLAGTRWRAVPILPDTAPRQGEHVPWLRFDGADVTGFSGCNTLSGRYDEGGDGAVRPLRFGPVAMTRRACMGHPAEIEHRLTAALSGTVEAIATERLLGLFDAQGVLLGLFERQQD